MILIDVLLCKNRDFAGVLRVVKDGRPVAEFPVLGRGDRGAGDTSFLEKGNTPTGDYVGSFADTTHWPQRRYGLWGAVRLEPLAGNAVIARDVFGRDRLAIHGGSVGGPDYWRGEGELRATLGCLRVSNGDMLRLRLIIEEEVYDSVRRRCMVPEIVVTVREVSWTCSADLTSPTNCEKKPKESTATPSSKNSIESPQEPPPVSETATAKPAVECTLNSVLARCRHGRDSSAGGQLEVVPADVGETVTLIAEVSAPCGEHPKWRVSGYTSSESVGATASFTANSWRVARPTWLANISPHWYSVNVQACHGKSRQLRVAAYPSDKLSVKIDAKTWRTAKDKLDYVIDNVLAQFLKKPKFELLVGSGKLEAGWEEYAKDHRAYYKYDASIGFNPLIGCSMKFPIGPTASIPEWVKKYGDAYIFVEFSGGISVNGHFGRKTPDTHDKWLSAKGEIEGKIGGAVLLMDGNVVSAEVAGGTGIEVKAKADEEAEKPTALVEIYWKGIKGALTVGVAWGIIEFKREVKIVDEGRLHDEPFRWELPTGE